MSWFGGFGGGSSGSDDKKSASDSYSVDTSSFENDSTSFGDSFAPSASGSLQEQLAMEQQKAMVQAVMLKLTDISFEKCVTKPSTSLSSSESSCISSVVS